MNFDKMGFGGATPSFEIGLGTLTPKVFESKGWRRKIAVFIHVWRHLPRPLNKAGYFVAERLKYWFSVFGCPICKKKLRICILKSSGSWVPLYESG